MVIKLSIFSDHFGSPRFFLHLSFWVVLKTARVFYCDPCDTPVNGREDPLNLGDGNTQTKWLDYSRNGFYVKLLGLAFVGFGFW